MKTTAIAISINDELLSVSKHFKYHGIISPYRPICWFLVKDMHADGNCLLRGIIFSVGNNEEMHLSPTKKNMEYVG